VYVVPKMATYVSFYCREAPSGLRFAQNVDSFLFRQISGARYVLFLAKVMPKFSVNFGMTCARKNDISSARDFPERELNDIPTKHRPYLIFEL
jgi:hypothetical protein